MTLRNSPPVEPITQRGSAATRAVLWFAAGVLAAVVVLLDPLGLHLAGPRSGASAGLRPADASTAHESMQMAAGQTSTPPAGERKVLFYRNPMDPTITSPVPRKDEMGMDYVPVYADQASPADGQPSPPAGERKVLFYRNPMDPTITSPVPRKDEMGMDYVPVYADQASPAAGQAASPADQGATVTIDSAVEQNMNVVTAAVQRRDVTRQIRTVGYLDYDQERMVTVTTKVQGYIEKSYVNYVGQPITMGEALFEIYSPELVQTQQELLSALRYVDQMKDAPEDARLRASSLVDAARTRLSYWDVTPAQIQRLEKSGKPFRDVTVYAPASGLVMKLADGLEGMAVKPGMDLLHIAGMSPLWLNVEVYEDQLPWVRLGSVASITLSYFPGERFTGKVRFIDPQVSEKTRSVGVTIEVPNRDRRLRTGMYATVLFEPVAAKNAITVPSQAVLRTGERNVLIVALGNGRFAPREVVLGPQGDGFVQVLSGLEDGERIVTSAQFLIDSESNLQQAIQQMIAAKQPMSANGGGNAR